MLWVELAFDARSRGGLAGVAERWTDGREIAVGSTGFGVC